MPAQVFNGNGPSGQTTKFSYTNNTGGNVRVRLMNVEGAWSSVTISGPGLGGSGNVNFGTAGTPRDYALSSGQTFTLGGSTASNTPYNILVIPEGG